MVKRVDEISEPQSRSIRTQDTLERIPLCQKSTRLLLLLSKKGSQQ